MAITQRWVVCGALLGMGWFIDPTQASAQTALRVVVTSHEDTIQPDRGITLREAIALVNGELTIGQLSPAERQWVSTPIQATLENIYRQLPRPRIEFRLPPDQTTIRLAQALPALVQPGTIVDGTTQPGYDHQAVSPVPIVTLIPQAQTTILRGLTLVADGVTVRGLSLAGFTAIHDRTETTPPADIFISHASPPPDIRRQRSPNTDFPYGDRDRPPQDIVIEQNWLGLVPPGVDAPRSRSAFGVSVFNSRGAILRHNRIAQHDGSGIITSVRAENLLIQHNQIARNGFAGMPDAIRLEGVLRQVQVSENQIQDNAGSAVYVFKPDGAVQIRQNLMARNGQRYRRSAIYLMGNDHRVIENQITDQSGPGVVVAAYPESDRNQIIGNQFAHLDGLSIDLVAQYNVDPKDYQQGDGINPVSESHYRRLKTGNFGIDAPVFRSPEFLISPVDGTVLIEGNAAPGATIELYRVTETGSKWGPLNQPIVTVSTTDQGQFSHLLTGLQPGDRLSATASHPHSGTSEPALNVVVRAIASSP